ncbi:MAG TPA: hypothetical protein VGS41_02685 [Chthonomonadales bacterium]|nr:hypothetical protein [Chthonomonadales bacterium]
MSLPDKQVARRAFQLGPGMIIACIAAGFLLWRQAAPHAKRKVADTLPSAASAGELSPPDPEWLVSNSSRLGLSRNQKQKLVAMEKRWLRNTRSLRQALQAGATREQAAVELARTRGATLQDLQGSAAAVSQVTRVLLAARLAWWDEFAAGLTAKQRSVVDRLWAVRLLPSARHGEPAAWAGGR